MTNEIIETTIAELGLTMNVEFVPFSRSRNKGEKLPSLNWIVTILRNGREVLTTDYMAGSGHCESYKASVAAMGGRNSIMRDEAIRRECEVSKARPDIADVLHSLVSDSDVLEYSTSEQWANDLGYDADSRKGEAIYRACLEIALKIRNGIGESGMAKLREAFIDY